MVTYVENQKNFAKSFSTCMIEVIPRTKNSHVDTLAKLTYTKDTELLNAILVEFLVEPSINH